MSLCATQLKAQSFSYTYEGQTLKYIVNSANSSFCSVESFNIAYGNLVIPEFAVDENGKSYKVVEIKKNAFGWSGDESGAPTETGNLTSVVVPNSVMTIGSYAFYRCKNLASITLSNALTTIGEWAFAECVKLKSCNLPNSVNEIGRDAFNKCSSLAMVNLPSELSEISDGCFAACTGLSSITIPDNVQKVGHHAFYYCMALETVKIGKRVSLIRYNAFDGCSELRELYCNKISPPSLGEDVFREVNTNVCKLYVPQGAEDNYRSKALWSVFTNIIGYDFSSESGISEINEDSVPTIIFDLQGKQVSNPTHGFYIINGKVVYIN